MLEKPRTSSSRFAVAKQVLAEQIELQSINSETNIQKSLSTVKRPPSGRQNAMNMTPRTDMIFLPAVAMNAQNSLSRIKVTTTKKLRKKSHET